MSNDVLNTMVVTGKSGFITNFKFEVSAPRPYDVKVDHMTRLPTDPLKLEWSAQQFSFWNVIAPPVQYFERYFSISGWAGGVEYGTNDELNWFNWNVANWSTKWDAYDIRQVEDNELPDGKAEWIIDFHTANTPPTNVFKLLAERYPELTFNVKSIEEQGWGEEAVYTGGRLLNFREWDIPKTHVEAEKIWSECPCTGKVFFYDDCTRWM